MPTGIKLDQCLLAFLHNSDSAHVVSRSGWTQLDNEAWTNGMETILFHKADAVDVAASGSTLTFTTGASSSVSGRVVRLSDWHGTTTPEASLQDSYSAYASAAALNPAGWGSEACRAVYYGITAANIDAYGWTDDHHNDTLGSFHHLMMSTSDSDSDIAATSCHMTWTIYWCAGMVAVRSGTAGPETADWGVEQDAPFLPLSSGSQAINLGGLLVHQQSPFLPLSSGGQEIDYEGQRYLPLRRSGENETPDRVDEDDIAAMTYPLLRRRPGGKPYWWDGVALLGGGIEDIVDVPATEADTTLFLQPDGLGGVEFSTADAGEVAYDNSSSGLTAVNAQAALDEIVGVVGIEGAHARRAASNRLARILHR